MILKETELRDIIEETIREELTEKALLWEYYPQLICLLLIK